MSPNDPPSGRESRRLQLDLPAVHGDVRVARSILRRFARHFGMPDGEVDSMNLVASELLANVIDHGGGDSAMEAHHLDEEVRMQLHFEVNGARWELAVSDQGGGDPEVLQKLFSEATIDDIEDDRGRGLFLTQAIADDIRVERNAHGEGLVVRVLKTYAQH